MFVLACPTNPVEPVAAKFRPHRMNHLRAEARGTVLKHSPFEDSFPLVADHDRESIERVPEDGVVPQEYPQHTAGYLKVRFHRIT